MRREGFTSEVDEGDGAGGPVEGGETGNGGPHGTVVGPRTPHYRHPCYHVQVLHCIQQKDRSVLVRRPYFRGCFEMVVLK